MATFPGITSRSSSLAGTRSSDENNYFVRPPRTPYPDTSSDENTLAQSISSSSRSPSQRGESIASTHSERTSWQSLPPSPLDNIPSRLHARFPRFSTTTEISQPDLSIEDVTSTRFSVDEEGIIAIPYNSDSKHLKPKQPGRFNRTIKKAISQQTMFLKKARVEVRRMPSNWRLVSKPRDKSGHPPGLPSKAFAEDSVPKDAPVLPAIQRKSEDMQLKTEAEESDPFVYGCSIRENAYRPVSKLSDLEEHRNSFDSKQETPRPVTAITIKPKREPVTYFPPNTMRYKFPSPSFTPHVSTTTVNTYHTALERPLLRRPSPLARSSREIPRSLSSGSAADNRLYPFSFPQERLVSSSNLSSRHNSMVSLSQTLTPRPYSLYSRPVSARSDDWRTPPLQREALFVEMSSQSKTDVSFVFPPKPEPSASRASLSSQPHSRATSIHSIQANADRPVIIRSASMVQVSHRDEIYRKVPLFVPARIEKHDMAGHDEPPPWSGRRDSLMSATDGACDENGGSRSSKSELSNWSMTYKESPLGRVSIDLESDSATIRPSKRGPLKEIINQFSTKKPRHSSFAQGCGSCVRRLSRVLRGKQAEALTSASTEKLRP